MKAFKNATGQKQFKNTIGSLIEGQEPLTFSKNDTIEDILNVMSLHCRYAGGVVDDKGCLIGLITDREITRRIFSPQHSYADKMQEIYDHRDISRLSAWDIMIASPAHFDVNEDIESAFQRSGLWGYRYIPVTNKRGKFLGIVDSRILQEEAHTRRQSFLERQTSMLNQFLFGEPYGGAGGFNYGT
jgi:CBS domain-containing protein